MRRFIVTAYLPNDADPFLLTEPELSYTVFVTGLSELQKFIQRIFPKGKKRSKKWYGRQLRKCNPLQFKHGLFHTSLFDIQEVTRTRDNWNFKNCQLILQLPLTEPAPCI